MSATPSQHLVDETSATPPRYRSKISYLASVNTYLKSLIPFITWIDRYDSSWLASDLIAGITVGAIVVPQGMAYASLAKLDPQFGLYSSFVGVMIYWLFGTSKDISIGPVAVLSTVVGNLVNEVHASDPGVSPYVVAASLSVITGGIVLLMGLVRCGWIVKVISAPSLSAFMTGSAITIAVSQLPSLLGLTGFSSRDAPYRVIINVASNLREMDINAWLGLTALTTLYSVRFGLTTVAERLPKRRHTLYFLNNMRAVAVIAFYTLLSWALHWRSASEPEFEVLGPIPQGLQHFGVPPVNWGLFSTIAPYLPASIVVMLVEHMAIAKSFGRQNDYKVNPSQEMVAIGVTNLIGPCFGAYASTGSFSRSAIQSKAGARSPMAGLVTGLVVLLAIQSLTTAFYYIPSAVLSAVIIHAVGDLIARPSTVRQYWRISPLELLIFVVGVAASILESLETGLYASVALSTASILYRSWAGRPAGADATISATVYSENSRGRHTAESYGTFKHETGTASSPVLDCNALSGIETAHPIHPGVVPYRLPTALNYLNAAEIMEGISRLVNERTQRTPLDAFEMQHEHQWYALNGAGHSRADSYDLGQPYLIGVVLDFELVSSVDVTAMQELTDLKTQIDSYASPIVVDWHVKHVVSDQVQRALRTIGLASGDDCQTTIWMKPDPENDTEHRELLRPNSTSGEAHHQVLSHVGSSISDHSDASMV